MEFLIFYFLTLIVRKDKFDKLGVVFLILIVDKGVFVINLVEYKEIFAKLSYLLL